MNWFKHDSDALTDAKIKKLLIRYGTEGYAIYFHCLELIAGDINESNITFELEHDAEIIADNLKIKGTADKAGIDIVSEIMKYIVSIGLFQESNGHIFCFKLLKRLDSSMTSNTKLRSLITKAKEHHDKVMINHDDVMQEETRQEETRRDKKKREIKHEYGEYKNVLLTDKQYAELVAVLTEPVLLDMIKKVDIGIAKKGYVYKNFKAVIVDWYERETKEKEGKKEKQACPKCGAYMSNGKCPRCDDV